MRRSRAMTIAAGAVIAAPGALAIAVAARSDARKEDQGQHAGVAERGRQVMPFDLERSNHRFVKTREGGVQTVVSDDGDPGQIALIRAHLRREARLFRQGVFEDPVTIHGPEMPGVADIRAGATRIEITYTDVVVGGRLRYRSDEPDLIDALHRWFDAQVSDHGAHAEGDT